MTFTFSASGAIYDILYSISLATNLINGVRDLLISCYLCFKKTLIDPNVITLGTTALIDFDMFDNAFDIDGITLGKYELYCAHG